MTILINPPASSAPSGPASGDLGGNYPGPSVAKINGTTLGTLSGANPGQAVVWTGSPASWQPGLTIDPLAVALGFKNWNFSPYLINNAGAAPFSGRIECLGIYLPPGTVVNNISVLSITGGTGTAPTGAFVGLAGPTGVMLAQSANVASTFGTGNNKWQVVPMGAAYTAKTSDSASGLYYIVILVNGTWGTTQPAYAISIGNLGNNPQSSALPFCGSAGTGQTALPANGSSLTLAFAGEPIMYFAAIS